MAFWSGISTGLLVLVPLEGPILGRHSLVYMSYLGSSPAIKIHCYKIIHLNGWSRFSATKDVRHGLIDLNVRWALDFAMFVCSNRQKHLGGSSQDIYRFHSHVHVLQQTNISKRHKNVSFKNAMSFSLSKPKKELQLHSRVDSDSSDSSHSKTSIFSQKLTSKGKQISMGWLMLVNILSIL